MATCPNCDVSSDGEATECPQCGVVFAKFQRRAAAREARAITARDGRPSPALPNPLAGVARLVRFAALVLLLVWTWQFARAPLGSEASQALYLHLPNLVFHEAGHVLFMFFGRFMTVLGGSLCQFLVPVILTVAFLRQRNVFGAVVCAWWAGENLVDVAPYIADSRALQLTLIGGRTGAEVEGHDWEYLLTQLGWLHLDVKIGAGVYRAGVVLMFVALGFGVVHVARHRASATVILPEERE